MLAAFATVGFTVVSAAELNSGSARVVRGAEPQKVVNLMQTRPGDKVYRLKNSPIEVVKRADGSVVRRLAAKPGKGYFPKEAAARAESGDTFYEDFEGLPDGETDWLPEGWTEDVKLEVPGDDGTNWTWRVDDYAFFSGAFSGSDFAKIPSANLFDAETFEFTMPPQDDWLKTPAVTPKAGDELVFYLAYSPGWTLADSESFETGNYTFNSRHTNLEVLISDDSGKNWTKVWDAIEDDATKNYTQEELAETLFGWPYKGFRVNLDKYVGKSIQVAFRYVGSAGQEMYLEDVTIGKAKADASYKLVSNLFYSTPDKDGTYYPFYRLAGVDTPVAFSNTSVMTPDASTWTWYNAENPDGQSSTAKNLSVTSGPGENFYPSLVNTVGSSEASYAYGSYRNDNGEEKKGYWYAGGTLLSAGKDLGGGAGNYNTYGSKIVNLNSFLLNDSKAWSDETQTKTLKAIGSFFPKPDAPYVLRNVYVHLVPQSYEGSKTSPIRVSVYGIDDKGQLTKELAFAEATYGDVVTGKFSEMLPFRLQTEDETIGVPADVNLTVSTPIMIKLSCADENVHFAPFCIGNPSGPDYANTYVFLAKADGTEDPAMSMASYGFSTGGVTYIISGAGINTDATYMWLKEKNGDYRYDVEAAGGSKTFTFSSYVSSDDWSIEGEGLGEWVSVEKGAYNAETKEATLKVTVSPLASGEKGNYTKLKVVSTIDGLPTDVIAELTVAQGESAGVSAEVADGGASKATVSGHNIVLSSAKATAATVYSVAGQRVADVQFSGAVAVDASAFAPGLYIVRFNDNTVAKVVVK